MCGCCRENSGETCYSRPSETDSPRRDMQKQAKVTLELSLRRRAIVLSEALSWRITSPLGEGWSRSGEEGSPQRACEKPPRAFVVISPKRGLQLERGNSSCLNEGV
ncbi:hypothetical protein DEO72_LG10g2196 [Vigna unguiculata]|uniref:Uncharacterized protein n=1 Tax=Vigna unguiculata TaxID=3917 RepID=A0A4D6NAV0_VIGUN|nr:hypothetical protein DEO72_LG10g2196 [Vigna unguiculata]